MHSAFKQLRDDYVAALRPVVAETQRWWESHCDYPHTEQRPFAEKSSFHRRWVAGPAAHPRVLGLLREYWFKVMDLNERFEQQRRDEGRDSLGALLPMHRERPIDLLVNDLSTAAPDLFEVMQGVIYVPIGIHPEDGLEC
jgi:hypothetical protein